MRDPIELLKRIRRHLQTELFEATTPEGRMALLAAWNIVDKKTWELEKCLNES